MSHGGGLVLPQEIKLLIPPLDKLTIVPPKVHWRSHGTCSHRGRKLFLRCPLVYRKVGFIMSNFFVSVARKICKVQLVMGVMLMPFAVMAHTGALDGVEEELNKNQICVSNVDEVMSNLSEGKNPPYLNAMDYKDMAEQNNARGVVVVNVDKLNKDNAILPFDWVEVQVLDLEKNTPEVYSWGI